MTPPINIDGSTVDAITIDGTEVTEVTAEGEVVFGSAIPDSVVDRPADDSSTGVITKRGLQIETTVEWPEIDAEISANTSGQTTAYVYRTSDGALYGSADISSLSAGDVFTISLDTNLIDGETYNFVIDAGDSTWTEGFKSSASVPISSSDGNLTIVGGGNGTQSLDGNDNLHALTRVGNLAG